MLLRGSVAFGLLRRGVAGEGKRGGAADCAVGHRTIGSFPAP